MIRKFLLIIIGAIINCVSVHAQYTGGRDDGSARSSLHGSRLSGEIASFTALYQGNFGDGFDALSNQVLLSNSYLKIYGGSIGDGFSQNSSIVTINGNNINSLYAGASGDGHSQNDVQSLIDGERLSMLFTGNIGDGSDFAILSSVFLEGFLVDIFQGGSGDGVSSLLKSENYLTGLMLNLYDGGNGDGFSANAFTSTLTLDIIEQLKEMNVLLYPNPASHIVHIKPNDGIIITSIQLYDISGKKINVTLSDEKTLDVTSLSNGIYLLNIFSEDGSVSKKLVIKK